MTDFQFTPTDGAAKAKVPYYEDARADFAPYYRTKKANKAARNEVAAELAKLDGVIMAFREGYFGAKPKRYGYEIEFLLFGRPAVLRVAGLPMYSETPAKKAQVLVQALLNVRDWLKTLVTQQTFQPSAVNPLVVHMLMDNGRTVGEEMAVRGRLPEIGSGISEGEFSEG